MAILVINNDDVFKETLKNLSNSAEKLIVVDFYANWCTPCTRMEQDLKDLSTNFPSVSFLKVDIDECVESVQAFNVVQIPTFIFFRGGQPIDTVTAADVDLLRRKLVQLTKNAPGSSTISTPSLAAADACVAPVPGFMDLSSMLDKTGCECLNCHSDRDLDCALRKDMTYLASDTDEQLVIFLTFAQAIRLHSLRITAPIDSGPKNIKIFMNQTTTPDFDACENGSPVQEFTLTPDDLKANALIPLKYVKFQNVNSVTIFVKDNQQDLEETRITNLILYGSPVQNVTNMGEFKRVAGKKGEVHG